MKTKCIFTLFIVFQLIYSQKAKLGVRGGINFSEKPEVELLNTTLNQLEDIAQEKGIGYHGAIFFQVEISKFYIRPELVYTYFKTEYVDQLSTHFSVENKRVDVPVLLGIEIADLVFLHIGPQISYHFEETPDLANLAQQTTDKFSVGYQFGGGVSLGNILLEARYEKALSESISTYITNNYNYRFTNIPSQFFVSIGYTF